MTNILYDDLCNILARVGVVDKICQIIPHIIHSVETSTVLAEHSQAERFLEKAFDTLQNLLESNSNMAKARFCNESVLAQGFIPVIQKTISDPSPITLNIIKRFIKLLQLATFSPHTYPVINLDSYYRPWRNATSSNSSLTCCSSSCMRGTLRPCSSSLSTTF